MTTTEPTISKITKIYTRTYSDSGQVTTYVEWVGTEGASGRTEGSASNPHMRALIARGRREGVRHTPETW